MDSGLFRVPVPNFDRRAFREAFVNALVHRDFTRLGMVRVLWEVDGIRISGPGGFPEGVTQGNILTVDPIPRNPLLADVLKRIGLAERTEVSARGVLERLVELGLVEAHGVTRDRSFTLGARIYRELGQSAGYVRQTGVEVIHHEAMVLKLAKTKGAIKRSDVIDLCGIGASQAKMLLRRLVEEGRLIQEGQKRWTIYRLKS